MSLDSASEDEEAGGITMESLNKVRQITGIKFGVKTSLCLHKDAIVCDTLRDIEIEEDISGKEVVLCFGLY